MDEDNTMEQAIRRLLYAMFDEFPERVQGKALRLLAAVVEAHARELARRLDEIVEHLKPQTTRPEHEDFRPFNYEKWNNVVCAWDRKEKFYLQMKAIAEGKT